jgi:transglutaminase-like putative cysteine protease
VDTRLGWLAAAGGLALILARMDLLLLDQDGGLPWGAILAAALILGGAFTAAALLAGARTPLLASITLFGAFLALARVAAGPTLLFGFVPTLVTLEATADEVGVGLEVIRFGAAPVLAVAGLVAVLAALFWVLAALIVYGGVKRRPTLMVVPVASFYLVLATLDRSPVRWWWPAGLALVGALALLAGRGRRAAGRARNSYTGRMIPASGRSLPSVAMGAVLAASVLSSGAFAATVPESGIVAWRNATGFGGGLFGGVAYNLFTGMQQDLVGNDSTILFYARVSRASPPNDQLYWKLITLDSFDGDYWLPSSFAIKRPSETGSWEAPEFRFSGPTIRVEQVVQIESLRQTYLPVLYSPVALRTDDSLLGESYRVREDGSITFDARTADGLTYRVTSDLPQPDLSMLASLGGELSPIFAQAASEGAVSLRPSEVRPPLPPSRVRETYTDLPDDLPQEVQDLAAAVTDRAATSFERALLLEAFFRSSTAFEYDAGASTGHSTLNLAAWLTDPESPNYRRGYCEQFATAMAVMARTLGLPSRVVMGFAPGEQVTRNGQDLIVVRARHAHAWVEIYFGGQGWVRFDPTPRGDGINPPTVSELGFDPSLYLPEPGEPGSGSSPSVPTPLRPGEEFLEPGSDPTLGLPSGTGGIDPSWLGGAALILALIGLVPFSKAARRRQRRRRVGRGDLGAAWAEITDRLRDLGYSLDPSRTPRETAVSIDRGLLPLAGAFSASVYGNRLAHQGREVLDEAEARVRRNHQGWRWWRSWWNPLSLVSRGPLGQVELSDRRPGARR